jgi:hypothetical protein
MITGTATKFYGTRDNLASSRLSVAQREERLVNRMKSGRSINCKPFARSASDNPFYQHRPAFIMPLPSTFVLIERKAHQNFRLMTMAHS